MLDIDILNFAQSRIDDESHWLRSKLVMFDETVVALGYVILAVN